MSVGSCALRVWNAPPPMPKPPVARSASSWSRICCWFNPVAPRSSNALANSSTACFAKARLLVTKANAHRRSAPAAPRVVWDSRATYAIGQGVAFGALVNVCRCGSNAPRLSTTLASPR